MYVGKKTDYVNTSVSTISADDRNLKCGADNRSKDASHSSVKFNQRVATVAMMPAAPAFKFNQQAGNLSDDDSQSSVMFNNELATVPMMTASSSVKFNQRVGNRSDDDSRSSVKFNQRIGNRFDECGHFSVIFVLQPFRMPVAQGYPVGRSIT